MTNLHVLTVAAYLKLTDVTEMTTVKMALMNISATTTRRLISKKQQVKKRYYCNFWRCNIFSLEILLQEDLCFDVLLDNSGY